MTKTSNSRVWQFWVGFLVISGGLLGQSIIVPAEAVEVLDRVVAVVNDEVIVNSTLEQRVRTIKAQLKERNTNLPSDAVIRRQVLERLITDQLQLQMAARNGITVSEAEVNKAILKVAQKNRLNLVQFQQALEREGYDFGKFREEVRNEMVMNQLQQQQVKNQVKIPEYELKRFMETPEFNQKIDKQYQLGHILIALAEASNADTIEKARLKAEGVIQQLKQGADFASMVLKYSDSVDALKEGGGDLGWRKSAQLPSAFGSRVLSMQAGEVSEPIRSASGFHIIKLLAVRGDEEAVIEQLRVRHILVRTSELVAEDEAKTRLNQIKSRVEGGEDFAALAQSNSDDTGSALKGGELGWVSPGDVVPEFQEAIKALPLKAVSAPFQTEFGWHIAQVLERRQYNASDDLRKAQARTILAKRKMDEALEVWLRRLRDEAYIENRLNKE